MSAKSPRSEQTGLPPFVTPYLQTLDRIQQHKTLRPDQLTERAQALLFERYGRIKERVEAAFSHAAVGLLAGHTNYFDGFAVLMTLQHGTAVAVRETPAPVSQLTFEGSDEQWPFDRTLDEALTGQESWPAWARIVAEVVRRLGTGTTQVEVAVVSTVQPGCMDVYLAALGVATTRAIQALFALPERTADLLPAVNQIIVDSIEIPFSIAYLIAAEAGVPGVFTLVDAATHEHLPVEAPPRDALGWGLIGVGAGWFNEVSSPWKRKDKADKAVALLQRRGFEALTSLRELEHRDLERALHGLPYSLKPLVRHLVTENRRVQKLVFAVRRRDWQMFGALLLMSHASLRSDWRRPNQEVDFVVEQVEAMSLDGMYGACATGRSGCVLVVGQPFVVPLCFDRVGAAFAEHFGRVPEMVLL